MDEIFFVKFCHFLMFVGTFISSILVVYSLYIDITKRFFLKELIKEKKNIIIYIDESGLKGMGGGSPKVDDKNP